MTRKMIFDNETLEASPSDGNAVANATVEGGTTCTAQRPTSLLSSTLNTPVLTYAPSFPPVTNDVTPTLVITPTTLNSILDLSFTPTSPAQSHFQQQGQQCQESSAASSSSSFVEPSSSTSSSWAEPSTSTMIPSTDIDTPMQMETSNTETSVTPQTVAKRTLSSMELEDSAEELALDDSLAQAAVSALTSGSLTPLVKEELKYSIQNKRLRSGQDELTVEFKEPEPEQLSKEEEDKRKRRRERNRLAAQRCRNKRKNRMTSLEEESRELISSNSTLKKQIRMLELEKQKLSILLRCHDISDQCPHKTKLSIGEEEAIIKDIPSVTSSEQTMSVFGDSDSDSDGLDGFEMTSPPGAENEVEVYTSTNN